MNDQEFTPAEATELSLDRCLRLISSRRRRVLLGQLLADPEVSETDLVKALTVDAEVEDDGEAEATVVQLYHIHLPMLDQHGVVDWERDDGVVRRGSEWPRVAELLDVVDRAADRPESNGDDTGDRG